MVVGGSAERAARARGSERARAPRAVDRWPKYSAGGARRAVHVGGGAAATAASGGGGWHIAPKRLRRARAQL